MSVRRFCVAAAIVLALLAGCGDSDTETDTNSTKPSAGTTGTQPGATGPTRTGTTDERPRSRARRRATRTKRRARRQEQGRLGAQTGGAPAQGETRGTPRPGGRVATIVLSGGGPVGGVQRIRFQRGKRVRLIVQSNTDEVVRVTGYGLEKRVLAGGSARFLFETTKRGLFSIELERGRTPIGVLQVG